MKSYLNLILVIYQSQSLNANCFIIQIHINIRIQTSYMLIFISKKVGNYETGIYYQLIFHFSFSRMNIREFKSEYVKVKVIISFN